MRRDALTCPLAATQLKIRYANAFFMLLLLGYKHLFQVAGLPQMTRQYGLTTIVFCKMLIKIGSRPP